MSDIKWEEISHFEGPEKSPGFLLWQASTKWRRQMENALSPLGLTHMQFVLLANVGWLTRSGNRVTQVELADHCSTDVTMTSQVLRTLERKGYLEREQREGDERAKFPSLTLIGSQLVEKAIPVVEKIDQEFFGETEQAREPYRKILLRLLAETLLIT